MKRRDFFRIIGGAALAVVGARVAKARVCVRDPLPYVTPSDHAALLARVTAIEAANTRTTGVAIPGPSITIVEQAIERAGHVVTINIQLTSSATIANNALIVTLPVGFRPSQTIQAMMLHTQAGDTTASTAITTGIEIRTNGEIRNNGGHSRIVNRKRLNFAFVQ